MDTVLENDENRGTTTATRDLVPSQAAPGTDVELTICIHHSIQVVQKHRIALRFSNVSW
jgi:hypothetical protein